MQEERPDPMPSMGYIRDGVRKNMGQRRGRCL